MGKMRMGQDPRNKEFKKVAQKVMEKHRNTFQRLVDDIEPKNLHTGSSLEDFIQEPTIKQDLIVPTVREVQIVEKQQDIHHHVTVNNVKTVDKRTRKYAKALRKEAYKQRETLSRLLNTVQRVQSERMSKIEKSVLELQIPQEKQVVTHTTEVKYVLDKRLIVANILLLALSILTLILK
jgi:hypothetical protein